MGRFASQFESLYRAARDDIFVFCALLGFRPTWQQRQLLELVQRGHKHIAAKSGHGVGKTAVSVCIALWRLLRDVDALVVVMAPTMRQAKQWLDEARQTIETRADPLLRKLLAVTATSVTALGRPNWRIQLVTGTKTENVAGIHRDHLTFIMDESSGIKREIFEAVEGTLTNEDALMVLLGNPTNRDGVFFDCFNIDRHRWSCVTFNSAQSPIVTQENVRRLAEKYGDNSDLFRIRVLGEFPLQDPQCVISSEDAEACTQTNPLKAMLIPDEGMDGPAKQTGLDFARFGSDESVIFRRTGLAIVEWQAFSHEEPGHVVDTAFRWQSRAKWKDHECIYVPDASGMGQGVLHKFYDAGKQVHEFHNHGVPHDPTYDDKVTEAWFLLGELLKARLPHIPRCPRLIHQLSTRRYYTTKKGKLALESKDDFAKRSTDDVGGSPDRADALVTTYYPHARMTIQSASRGRKHHEANVWEDD